VAVTGELIRLCEIGLDATAAELRFVGTDDKGRRDDRGPVVGVGDEGVLAYWRTCRPSRKVCAGQLYWLSLVATGLSLQSCLQRLKC